MSGLWLSLWVPVARRGREFRVELTGQKPGVILELDHLHELTVLGAATVLAVYIGTKRFDRIGPGYYGDMEE